MPTATTTLTSSSTSTTLKVKSSMNGSSSSATATAGPSSSTSATLRSMYNRAAKAFLNRDISLTNSLLHSAFTLIPSPLALLPGKTDALCSQRRKWEILRITMETTIYASPRNPADPLPQDLREMLIKSPHSLVQSMYTRSLELFTPTTNGQTKRDSAYLPSQVLTTLIYSSLKLDCPDVGRKMIEEWLARWGLMEADPNDDGGYDKVVELYTLQVLPKVHDWVYAKEFLDYETELPKETREALKTSLHALHEQYLKSLASPKYPETPTNGSAVVNGSSIQRSHSPASSSSSLSTTSTHTAVPSTPRQPLNGRNGNARSPLASRPRSEAHRDAVYPAEARLTIVIHNIPAPRLSDLSDLTFALNNPSLFIRHQVPIPL
ncbi:hypothetical protein ONZ45_g3968 [Pleurotus djamor]|nr:hypothetical protein ONZ45_g3968 [Pleurotus djamor]